MDDTEKAEASNTSFMLLAHVCTHMYMHLHAHKGKKTRFPGWRKLGTKVGW